VEALFAMLQSNRKKVQPKKWWSVEVMQQLLKLYLDYYKAFGGNTKQDTNWLTSQKAVVRSKFETDQKNCEDEIACKGALKEGERVKATKNHKLTDDNSSKLVQCLEAFLAWDENEKIMQLRLTPNLVQWITTLVRWTTSLIPP
jgi:hypothetical protein